MIIKMLIVAALGAPPVAVVIFEVLLNATAMFNHGNIRIHINADRILRLLVVTPYAQGSSLCKTRRNKQQLWI